MYSGKAPIRGAAPAPESTVAGDPVVASTESLPTPEEYPPPRHAIDKNLRRVLNESALETDVASGTASSVSLDLPATMTSDRIRRRSDVSRLRPPILHALSAAEPEPEAFELPTLEHPTAPGSAVRVLGDISEDAAASTGGLTDGLGLGLGPPERTAKGGDPELAPSFPSSLAPSVRAADETDSMAPAISSAQKAVYKRKSLLHFLALCWCVFGMGWNDGTTGPMLPRIQEHYKVNFAIVSLIFVFNASGYIVGAVANVYMTDRLGFGKVLMLGALLQILAYVMISPATPFPVICCAFAMIGFGLSIQNAHANGFVASLRQHATTKLGLLHGSYGLGALISPLVSTQFAKSPSHWSYHYVISVGVYISITSFFWYAFRGKRQEELLEEEGQFSTDGEVVGSNKYKQIFGLKEVHFLSLWALIYVGVEVTIGAWSVTYILQNRHGNSNAGYISSGFFGGLMLGRVVLMSLNKKIGERLAVFLYTIIAIALEITVWLVPSLIENAIAVTFVGLVLGPMYPIMVKQSVAILPRWLFTGCMGYIGGIGQAGSAVLPFLTGLLASRFGIASLQPFIVSMMSTLIVIWAMIPRARYVPT